MRSQTAAPRHRSGARRAAPLAALAVAAALLAARPGFADARSGWRASANGHSNPQVQPAAPSSAAQQSAAGVVQSLSDRAVIVRQLDGSVVSVPLGRQTQITLDGRPAHLSDIRPGYVLAASWSAGQSASALRFERSN